MSRPYAADEYATIRSALEKLQEARMAVFQCACTPVIDDAGERLQHNPECPVHREAPGA